MVSQKFKDAVKLYDLPAYKLAQAAGIHPSTLSQIVCGIQQVKNDDSRVIDVGNVLGLTPEECFEEGPL